MRYLSSLFNIFNRHDSHAAFVLMLDSMVNLATLSSILIAFGFPADLVLLKILPGSTVGVLVGNILYALLALRLRQQSQDPNVTAMPLGLDTPSTIGLALTVLGPSFIAQQEKLLEMGLGNSEAQQQAAYSAWGVGMSVVLLMSCLKIICSFFSDWISTRIPPAGLLGSIGGVGLALLGFLPLLEIFKIPEIGLLSFGIIIYALIARIPLPWQIPGAALAILLGTLLYYVLGPMGLLPAGQYHFAPLALQWSLPSPTLQGLYAWPLALPYLPLAIPFALLTVVGGLNVVASARVAGDRYQTREILLAEACAGLCSGFFGGVVQTTPYLGHLAYKRMGAKISYTLIAGCIVGIGGIAGCISYLIQALPLSAMMPVLIFVGLEIAAQAFTACPARYAPAILTAFLPTLANLVLIQQNSLSNRFQRAIADLSEHAQAQALTLHRVAHEIFQQNDSLIVTALGHGFILTAMLWGSMVSCIIDRQLRKAAAFAFVTGCMAASGVIHTMSELGGLCLPWLNPNRIIWHWVAGYWLLATMLLSLSWSQAAQVDQATQK